MNTVIIEKYTGVEFSQKENLDFDERMQEAHENHQRTKEVLENSLSKFNVAYSILKDDQFENFDESNYDFVISLGGDGTALRAANKLREVPLFPINSSVTSSVGALTTAALVSIENKLENYLEDRELDIFDRVSVAVNGSDIDDHALNEVFIGNMYITDASHLDINESESVSNGIIVSTRQGSTGWYKSTGLEQVPKSALGYSTLMQYSPKDSINGLLFDSKLIVSSRRKGPAIVFDSDRENRSYELQQGDQVSIGRSKSPLKIIGNEEWKI